MSGLRRRRSPGVLWVAVVLTAGGCGQSRPPSTTTAAAVEPRLDAEPRTIAPGVHYLGGLHPSAAYVVETDDGLVLIDAGAETDAVPLKAQMAALGLDPRQIRLVLLTHVHADHCGGAEAIRTATGARVYAGAGDADVLRAGGPPEAFFSTFGIPNAEVHPTTVDVELHGGEEISRGDVRLQVIGTPGHTPGSVCYLLEKGGQRFLFSGDVVRSVARNESWSDPTLRSPLGTYSAYRAPRYRGDARAFLATLRELRSKPAPDYVLPGHPRMDAAPPSPRVEAKAWARMLDEGIREMEELVARYAVDGAPFLDGVPKHVVGGVDYLGDRDGRSVYGLFDEDGWVLVNAPGGAGLVDFTRERLAALGRPTDLPRAVLITGIEGEVSPGLVELVKESGCAVVVAHDARDKVRAALGSKASVVGFDEVAKYVAMKIHGVPLEGRALGSAIYWLQSDGVVLALSGRIPVKPSGPSMEALASDLAGSSLKKTTYLSSLARLDAATPAVWLPAEPTNCQNARLYDHDWSEILARNRAVAAGAAVPH